MIWGALIVAAGRGIRLGRPKQFIDVAGLPLVGWSLRTLGSMPEIVELVIATEPDWIEPMQALARRLAPEQTISVVAGGTTRQKSVQNALARLSAQCTGVIVHDGARPLLRTIDVRAAMSAVRPGHAAVLAVPVVDTIKRVDSGAMVVRETLAREELWAAQTPQCAQRRDLERAYAAAGDEAGAPDDAALLERCGVAVTVVPSTTENFKVTNPEDLARAHALLRERAEHAPLDEEMLFIEIFADDALVNAIERELEMRGARIDGIDRDLPRGIAVRAFIPAERLRGFAQRFEAFSDGSATFTTRFSHYAGRDEGASVRQ